MSEIKKKFLEKTCLKIRSGGTPSTNNPLFYGGNIPFVTIDDMTSSFKFISETTKTITELGLQNSSCWIVPPKSILYSIYATLGVPRINLTEVATNQAILALIPNPEEVKTDYLFYYLSYFQDQIYQLSAQTTQSNLSAKIVKNFLIPLFDLNAQQAIAEVLTAVDQAITQTETLIAKYQRIKTGLMQDLLTRGIDENGNLRDPATHEFKDSSLGQVPKEWEVVTLGEVVAKSRGTIQTGPFGSQLHAHEYTPEGMPVIMPQNILADGSIDFQQIARIPPDRANDLKRHFVKNNDIVFARRGDLSRCVPIHRDNIGLCGTGCLLVRIPEDFLSATWLSFVYRHEKCQRQIAAQAVGSTMVNLNTQLLANLIITKPSVEEQRKISAKIKQLDTLIDLEMARFDKLKKVKTGLMQDLLTGKVSVAPLLEDSEGN